MVRFLSVLLLPSSPLLTLGIGCCAAAAKDGSCFSTTESGGPREGEDMSVR